MGQHQGLEGQRWLSLISTVSSQRSAAEDLLLQSWVLTGDMYAGEWVDDRRTGRGMYFSANGDIFVGSFIRDKKEGMGTL
jgi:hypothetical protein